MRVLIIIRSLVVVVVVVKWLIRILGSPINNTNPMNEKDQEHHYGHQDIRKKVLEPTVLVLSDILQSTD